MAQVTTQMVKEIWFYNPTKLIRRQTQNLLKLKGLHVVKTFKIKKYNWTREKGTAVQWWADFAEQCFIVKRS